MIKLNILCQIKEKINRAEARDKKLVGKQNKSIERKKKKKNKNKDNHKCHCSQMLVVNKWNS
jgi:hypothetical protein